MLNRFKCLTGILLCIVLYLTREITCLDACVDPWQNFRGYTYALDQATGEKIWSHCKFPNPKWDHVRCGMTDSSGYHFVCDPDHLVTAQVDQLDTVLKTVQTNTSTLCEGSDGEKESFILALAVINRMRIPDLSATDVCINDCGEIHPELNTTTRSPTDSELDTIMANFADHLRKGWGLGSCGNDVIILYCQEYNKVYTSVGSRAGSLLSDSTLSDMHSRLLGYINDGRLEEGLLAIVEEMRVALRSLTPAHILVILNVITLVIAGCFLLFFLHLSSLDLNIWGREKQWKVAGFFVYALSGVWIINVVLLGVIHISNKAPYWALIVCFAAAVGSIIVFVLEDQIFPNDSNTGTNITSY